MTKKPEKIRFTKRDFTELHHYPSATEQAGTPVDTPRHRPRLRRLTGACLSSALLILLLCGAAFVFLSVGIGGKMLTQRAEDALKSVAGADANATIQSAQISLDQRHHIALEARGVNIDDAKRGLKVQDVRAVRIGLATLPLLRGDVRVERLEIEGATIAVSSQGPFDFMTLVPVDDRGLVDLDGSSRAIFDSLASAVSLLDQRETSDISISDTAFNFTVNGAPETLKIVRLDLQETGGPVSIKGSVEWKGRQIELAASVRRATAGGTIEAFSVFIGKIPLKGEVGTAPVADRDGFKPDASYLAFDNTADLQLDGMAATGSEPQRIWGSVALAEGPIALGNVDDIRVGTNVIFEHVNGSNRIAIKPSRLHFGAFDGVVEGSLVPEAQGAPGYRFELATRRATSAPADSPEPPLPFDAEVSGRYDVGTKTLDVANIAVRPDDKSALLGRAGAVFGDGSPELSLSLQIPEMPVAQVKQLWPVWVATGARRWVIDRMFEGRARQSRIEVLFAAGHFDGPGRPPPLTADEVQVDFTVENSRFHTVGDLPPISEANGTISVRGAHTTIKLQKGVAITPGKRRARVVGGTLVIPWGPQRPVLSELDLDLEGDASAVAEIIGYKPINGLKSLPFGAADIKGNVKTNVLVTFPVSRNAPDGSVKWSAEMELSNVSIARKIDGQLITDADGSISVTQSAAKVEADAKLNGIPASVSLLEPLGDNDGKREQKVTLKLDDKTRNELFPALDPLLSGPISVDIERNGDGGRVATADLTKAEIKIAQIGWTKGAGVKALAKFSLVQNDDNVRIDNLDINGETFRLQGDIKVVDGEMSSADFNTVRLNRGDKIAVKVARTPYGYRVDVKGDSFDARPLLNQITDARRRGEGDGGKQRILVNADIGSVTGFYSEDFSNVSLSYEGVGSNVSGLAFNATSKSGNKIAAVDSSESGARSISLQSKDAGAVLRFFGYYDKMQGGNISVALDSKGDGPLRGQIDARNFTLVNEPRLAKLVSSSPNGTSLNDAVKRNIDVSTVTFERGFSQIEKGSNYINLANGVIRGSTIGTTFQGVLSDPNGNMSLTGTFMPAYGLNRLFGDLPVLGLFLGNGRDRGLIGITYKLVGPIKQPQIIVNPISAIAPGIFRSIFEFQ